MAVNYLLGTVSAASKQSGNSSTEVWGLKKITTRAQEWGGLKTESGEPLVSDTYHQGIFLSA